MRLRDLFVKNNESNIDTSKKSKNVSKKNSSLEVQKEQQLKKELSRKTSKIDLNSNSLRKIRDYIIEEEKEKFNSNYDKNIKNLVELLD